MEIVVLLFNKNLRICPKNNWFFYSVSLVLERGFFAGSLYKYDREGTQKGNKQQGEKFRPFIWKRKLNYEQHGINGNDETSRQGGDEH